jgi:hypothetical protein
MGFAPVSVCGADEVAYNRATSPVFGTLFKNLAEDSS